MLALIVEQRPFGIWFDFRPTPFTWVAKIEDSTGDHACLGAPGRYYISRHIPRAEQIVIDNSVLTPSSGNPYNFASTDLV